MISDRKQYIGIKNNIVFELFQFLFMLEWILACISRFSAHIPTSFSVFMPNICCLDKLDNKHYAYRLIMMWEYGQKNEKYWPGSIPAHIRIGKVLNIVIFDTNNCLFLKNKPKFSWFSQLFADFVCFSGTIISGSQVVLVFRTNSRSTIKDINVNFESIRVQKLY